MNKTNIALLAAFALGALTPSFAGAQAAKPTAHASGMAVAKKATVVRKTAVVKKTPAKKVTCRYQVQRGKRVKVCK